MATSQDFVNWICSEKLNPEFLKYILLAEREALHMFAVGSVHQTIYFPEAKAFHICMPARRTQDAIIEILGALDQKIELNRQMNATLETAARTLFKDWFIDFGPTRTKQAALPPYLAADIWSQFPNRLDAQGKPAGWASCGLVDLAELNPLERLPQGTMAPYFDMASLPTTGCCLDAPILREAGSGARFRNGDTLFARITPCLENGKTALVECLGPGEIAWGSTEFVVIRPRTPVPAEFGYLLARDENFRAHAIQSMTGTSGRQRAQPESLRTFPMVRPPDSIFQAFGDVVSTQFKRIISNSNECETLAATRDLLLPKLMSGEMRLRDAEKIVEAAA